MSEPRTAGADVAKAPTGANLEKTPTGADLAKAPTGADLDNLEKTELSQAARDQVAALRKRYPTAEAALIPTLHIAQREWGGWLPDAAIAAVARELGLAEARVYGVVTFYDLLHQKPVGRHRIRVCTNLPCQLRGAEEIMETLARELGVGEDEVTRDHRCSYIHFECLGSCDTAPMMMVDDEYHENLTPERVRQILKELA